MVKGGHHTADTYEMAGSHAASVESAFDSSHSETSTLYIAEFTPTDTITITYRDGKYFYPNGTQVVFV
jgi:hypothetical protein